MKRYKIILPLALIVSSLSLIQCNEGDLPDSYGRDIIFGDSIPNKPYAAEMKGLTINPQLLGLEVKWNGVFDEDLAYYEVEWQGYNQENSFYNKDTTMYSIQTKDTTYTISQLYNEIYTVKVRAVSKSAMKSEPLVKIITPQFDQVPPSGFIFSKATALAKSLVLEWDQNPSDEDYVGVFVRVAKKGTNAWNITQWSSPEDTIMSVVGLDALTEYDVEILPMDRVGNYDPSQAVKETLKTKAQKKLENMKIFRFYSQEAFGEGDINGRATCVVDKDVNTFYNSTWKENNLYWDSALHSYQNTGSVWWRGYISYFPQWIIIDLGESVMPTQITVWPRQNSSWGCLKMIKFEATSVDLTESQNDPDNNSNVFQYDLGTYEMPKREDKKPYLCELSNFVEGVRYIRINFLSAYDDQLARLAEIEIEALVNE